MVAVDVTCACSIVGDCGKLSSSTFDGSGTNRLRRCAIRLVTTHSAMPRPRITAPAADAPATTGTIMASDRPPSALESSVGVADGVAVDVGAAVVGVAVVGACVVGACVVGAAVVGKAVVGAAL